MSTYPREPTGWVETTPDGRRLVIRRTFRAPIDDVWASLTEPERFARWYGDMDGEAGPGRTVMVTMTAEEGPSRSRPGSSSANHPTASWSSSATPTARGTCR